MKLQTSALLATLLLAACSSTPVDHNPPSPGFDAGRSDARAIEIADQVMVAMGGRRAWDKTRCIQWNFADKRRHLWDKHTGDLRLDDGLRTVLMNLNSGQGRVFEAGEEIVRDTDKKRDMLERAYKLWVNGSYWLIAPYKMKDTGTRLTWRREEALPDGRMADVVRLEFDGVGVTPENAYDLWVARDTHLVERWAYFKWRGDSQPAMDNPWRDWRRYGSILLASDHGTGPATKDIKIYDQPPPRLFDPKLE
ncbi:MAG: hypothetical protein JNL28_10545 [Planctomycetes bacterium]|nr:hypothetical protein [Planctomycetota bacterium]